MSHVTEDLESGQRLVPTAGKPVRLVDQPYGRLRRVTVHALPSNTEGKIVYVGGPQTYAGEGDEVGYRGEPLYKRFDGPDSWSWDDFDPYYLHIDSEVSGEGVSFTLYGLQQAQRPA